MNKPLILRTLGWVLLCEAGAMLPSLVIAYFLKENTLNAFLLTIIVLIILGAILLWRQADTRDVGYKEGFVIATASWILMATFGAVPFVLTGAVPNFVYAFFETMSGFTTTGASVIANVEAMPKSLIFWRNLTQWLGGLGILVLTLALIPSLKIAGMKLFKAEVPGPTKDKMVPGIIQTARQLYKVYLTISCAQLLLLKAAGLSWFDSIVHTFTTVSTAGFSSQNGSIGSYNDPVVELIIIIFMFAAGINFALHYHLLRGNPGPLLKDRELKLYAITTLSAIIFIGINLVHIMDYDVFTAFRQSAFQVVSIITTTGYATADFDQWPSASKALLVLLMFMGGCAGSTAAGMKQIRIYILFKSASRQIVKLVHPQAVVPVRVGKNIINENVVETVQNYLFMFLGLQAVSAFILAAMGMDLVSAFTAVLATLANIGPGLGMVGPATTFASVPDAGKVILSICMLLGRLEIYTVLVVFSIRFWR